MGSLVGFAVLVACLANHGHAQPLKSIYVQPQQIHLSLAANGINMVATWSTEQSTAGKSFVRYGTVPFNLIQTQPASESKFLEENTETGRVMYVQRAMMMGLMPATTYFYSVGSNITISEILFFKTFPKYPEASKWQPQIALFGDLGNDNAQSLPRLQSQTQDGFYDAIIHVGDFAYDLPSEEGKVGDEFMRQIESIAGYVPYMTCPGNHEYYYNFSHYYNRFTMPEERADRTNMYYSFNMGPVHFVSVSTEHYHYMQYGSERAKLQYDWLVNDLKAANIEENRKLCPWIIMLGHRPMYCSNSDKDDCTTNTTATRVGIPSEHIPGMEKLLVEYKVDISIWAHEHDYERLWPIYNYKVVNGSEDEPYTNAKGPIHLTTGSGGCTEKHDPFSTSPPPMTAFRSQDYGYTIMKVHNGSVLEFSQVSDDKDGAIIDHIYVKKNKKQEWLTLGDYDNMA